MPSFGAPHRHYRRTDSTNARAKDLAEAGAPGGLVVSAGEQTAGRGRQGRSWFAPPGTALLYSALLRPLGKRPLLPIAVPVAVCEAAEAVAPVRCQVKWPNDVWIEKRKLAGILIESRAGQGDESWAVIGVGLNVAVPADELPAEIADRATSLGRPNAAGEMMEALNGSLGRWLEAGEEEVLGAFRDRDALSGRRVSWDGGQGVAAGIDGSGHLLVNQETGEQATLGAGEVHLDLDEEEKG